MREIIESQGDNEKRKAQFVRSYRAKLETNPLYALSKLLLLNALTEEDLAIASRADFYKVRNWAHANLGIADYSPADEGMPIQEAFA